LSNYVLPSTYCVLDRCGSQVIICYASQI
jgi:hypothetical protein